MNQTTSTVGPPKSSVGEAPAKIGVAIRTAPEKASVLFCWTFWKAITASLRNNSILVAESKPFYQESFVAVVCGIPPAQRAAALATVKQLLTDWDLLIDAEIAMDRAGESWISLHGFGVGGIHFGNLVSLENLESTLTAFQKWSEDKRAVYQALLDEVERRPREQGENPEAS